MPESRYIALKREFQNVCKRVLKKNLSTNPERHREYLTDLVSTYNAVIAYVESFHESLDSIEREIFRNDWIYLRDKVISVFAKLNVSIGAPRSFFSPLLIGDILGNYSENNTPEDLPENRITPDPRPSISNTEPPRLTRNKFVQTTKPVFKPRALSFSDSELYYGFSELFHDSTMAPLTSVEFIRIAAQTINRNYDGNPLGLSAFINSVELLKELSNAEVAAIFLRFVKSKLEGKALESVPADAANVDEIITALRQQIQPDNSKVVAGRLLALKPDKAKMTDFSEQAEKLAEALQRSLIIEGISRDKAREMTIDKTVEVCRSAARSDLVKAVLASTKFDSPKEAIAKFIVETSTEEKEKQVLAYRTFQRQNGRRSNRYNGNKSVRGKFNNNYSNRNNSGNNGGRGNNGYNNNNNYRNSGNNRSNRDNSNGNGRGRNNYGNNNGGGYRGNNGNNNRNVRYAENYEAPQQQQQLGEAQNRN